MDKTKLIGIVLLVIVLGVGFIAFQFYSENQTLRDENQTMKKERARMLEENKAFQSRYSEADRERTDLRSRWGRVQEELTRLQAERDDFKKKYESTLAERDMLVEKLKEQPQPMSIIRPVSVGGTAPAGTEDYWSDIVSAKAELEARLAELGKELAASNTNIAELDKQNKELSLKIDGLEKERGMLAAELKLKERTLNIMSRDLVSERESRKEMATDLEMMRDDNIRLKRELVVANKEKLALQKGISNETAVKEDLEQRIFEIESILKQKSMALSELQDNLNRALTGERVVVTQQAAAVELPPIVVKPEPGMIALEGAVIAVIPEERVVVIDKGEAAGARPGIPLKVLRGDTEIATLEIIETRREVAAADILEVVQGVTIQEGDKVVSR